MFNAALTWSYGLQAQQWMMQPVLAQVNVGSAFPVIMGAALVAAALALYFLRTFRPQLARDHDIFFSAVALVCGGIIFFQGWRLDPLLQLGQILLAGSTIFFAVENIRLRGVTVEQAKRGAPPMDDPPDDRPSSRVYRAELDDPPYVRGGDEYYAPNRRIRGREYQSDSFEDYPIESRRRPPSRSSRDRRLSSSDDRYPPSRRSRSRTTARLTDRAESRAAWDDEDDDRDRYSRSPSREPSEKPYERSPRPSSSRSRYPSEEDRPTRSTYRPDDDSDDRPAPTYSRRRRRPSDEESDASPSNPRRGEYVDYQPLSRLSEREPEPQDDF